MHELIRFARRCNRAALAVKHSGASPRVQAERAAAMRSARDLAMMHARDVQEVRQIWTEDRPHIMPAGYPPI